MDVGVGTKRRIQNPKCKHDTEGGKGTANLPWQFLELWPADYEGLYERNELCNNLEGRSDSGNNTSKWSKVTQP